MISQTIKKWGKAICPPLLLGLAKSFLKNFQQKNLEDNLIVYAPEGFATPLPPENNSWESDGVLSAHEQKWKAFNREVRGSQPFGFIYESDNFSNRYRVTEHNLNLTFAYVMSRVMLEIMNTGQNKNQSLRLLDWGGGTGHHFQLSKALLPSISVEFHCKEIAAMAKLGRKLNPDVHWWDEDDCFTKDNYDLVIIDGALQYIDDWRQITTGAANATKGYFFLTRTPVVQNVPGYVAIQHTYNSSFFHQQFNEEELLRHCRENHLKVIQEFATFEYPGIINAPEQPKFKGWLMEKD
jgi:putative methyltransferase (TIGR04325 family)